MYKLRWEKFLISVKMIKLCRVPSAMYRSVLDYEQVQTILLKFSGIGYEAALFDATIVQSDSMMIF